MLADSQRLLLALRLFVRARPVFLCTGSKRWESFGPCKKAEARVRLGSLAVSLVDAFEAIGHELAE